MKKLALAIVLSLSLAQSARATTIAFDGKTLAADSQVTTGGRKYFHEKIVRCDDAWVACAGATDSGEMFRRWYAAGHDPDKYPKVGDNFAAYVLTKTGCCAYWDMPVGVPLEKPFALGSGADAAIAAMKMGADARKAVEIASLIDLFTGGAIISHTAAELQ